VVFLTPIMNSLRKKPGNLIHDTIKSERERKRKGGWREGGRKERKKGKKHIYNEKYGDLEN
jgi:hypothetical protein